ncbi:hypothetical protein Caci_7667 [Catenulispora acidiphila DSM 44928]|uniref:Uncharacterized protein n=1 Tax=Catenulispora acidiphila (strain DSM 44928 / JCM 14897 / NBRC 102108 / NRRL B-24433 / ID139908) TaxID=479433 RepID=C7QCM8_CATAD|nr:hypothetical protein Caci_7667 [Catenulispora acidiphila DSM 44928]
MPSRLGRCALRLGCVQSLTPGLPLAVAAAVGESRSRKDQSPLQEESNALCHP